MRTEHRLRMAFDPEYAEKYESLIYHRKDILNTILKTLLSPIVIIQIIVGTTITYLAFKHSPFAFLIFPLCVLTLFLTIFIFEDFDYKKLYKLPLFLL